jgi:GNAT superfamily N-acetyltransferase
VSRPFEAVEGEIHLRRSPPLFNEDLNRLFARAWDRHEERDFQAVLRRSLVYVTAHCDGRLVGFVNVAWDGGVHGFVLDPTVDPEFQRRGVGRRLLEEAVRAAREQRLEWLHVDFAPALEPFYRAAGFRGTSAGVLRLGDGGEEPR